MKMCRRLLAYLFSQGVSHFYFFSRKVNMNIQICFSFSFQHLNLGVVAVSEILFVIPAFAV